jgi:MFS transporter, DHA1 family, tetracycline resistance protein
VYTSRRKLTHFATSLFSRTLLVYYVEERLNFNDKDIATMFLILGLLGVFVQGFLLKVLNDWCGERKVVLLAFLLGVVHNLIYAIAESKAVMFAGIAVGAFVGMSFPTISAIKSNNVVRCINITKKLLIGSLVRHLTLSLY